MRPLGFAAWPKAGRSFSSNVRSADLRVTAETPGAADPGHMTDNLGAMGGRLPDREERKQMAAFADTL
jgi:hypothetical protein